MKKMAPITTRRFDLRDHAIGRTMGQDLRFRYLPFGSYGGGPSLFILARLFLLHTLGGLALRVAYALEDSGMIKGLARLRRPPGNPRTSPRD
jgi:hypothetical protein